MVQPLPNLALFTASCERGTSMRHIIFVGVVCFCLIGFSSCVFYHDVVNTNKTWGGDMYIIYKDRKSTPLFSSGIMRYFYDRKTDISTVKLSYYFRASNIHLFDNPIIELHSFSFTNKKGDTIPCRFYYSANSYVTKDYVLDSTFVKIDTLPFSFDIKKPRTGKFNILVETDQLYQETKEVYVSFDITVNNQRITKKNIKYKWKLCVERFI